ncbi:MAG TPA: arsenite methyltransferase [Bacteroidales bacterium]|nr:arsenite methyltransferase [Bacteroidales bacterium]
MKAEDLKLFIQKKYSEIAGQDKLLNQSSCCGSTCGCSDSAYSIFSDDYSTLEGYNPDADLGLGCGLPTEHAGINPGDSVLDLGSGAGNDCFVAWALVGENGKVTGLDFTDAMLEKARINASKLNYSNVEFVKGDIESMPLPDNTYDVVISNCVLNLVPDKTKAFSEIYRVLKRNGHFCVSDVVLSGELPESLKNDAAMYAGCVAGAMQKDRYLEIIQKAGFEKTEVKKVKRIDIPDEILSSYFDEKGLQEFKSGKTGIFSITVIAHK